MPNTLRVKRGLASSLPNGASGEPLFTTDTYELYIGKGDGTNQRYQKYIASGTTSQYLRGDGTLETHNLDSLTDVIVSSPSNGQILQYNGTNWVNATSGFITGSATAAGQVGVFSSVSNIAGYTTFTFDTVADRLSMTNAYVNNNLTVDGQLVIKSESGASAYTRGLKFPDNSYGGTGDIAGLRLHNAGGENIILELYAGNDSLDTINFAVAAGGSVYNDNVTINGNKIWNAGNLPSPLSSTGSITSGEVAIFSNGTTVYSDTALFWDNSLNRLGVGGNSPNAQVGVTTSSGVNAFGYRTSGVNFYELVLAYDNTTYGHTFQANRGSTTSARNITFLNGSNTVSIDENGNMGIGLVVPNAGTSGPGGLGLDIYASTTAAIALHNATSGTGISAGGRIYYNSTNMTVRNLSTGNLTMTADNGDFVVITNGAENVRVVGSNGRVGIGNPASITEMLTVNGSIQQSGVLSSVIKTDSNGKFVAAVAGTDYVVPSALSGYVPTSRTLTINGTTFDLSANRSWTVGIIDGGGSSGRVTYWSDADTVTSDGGFIYDSSTKRLGVNTTVPNATIGATAASGYGLLIKNADANYGGIGMGVDATYGNLINTEKVGIAPARNLTLLNQAGYVSIDEIGDLGINILNPDPRTTGPGGVGIDIYSGTTAALAFHNAASGTGISAGGRIYYNSTNMTIRNVSTGNINVTVDNGNFNVITLGAENIKVEGSTGRVGIGAPASIAEMLTVNGSIQQSGVTSAMLRANSSGKIIAAVSNTDFQAPITLTTTGTSGAATFNGTTLNIPQYQAAGNYITGAGNSGYLPKYTGQYTIANSLVYDNGSRVMINTTTDNTVEMLQVNGGIRGTSLRINSNFNSNTAVNVLGQIYVDNRSSQGGNRIFLTPNTTSTTPYVHFYEPFTAFNTNGGISIGTSSGITTTPTDSIMHWDANNIRVGINKTNPSTTLDVNGAATFSSSVTAGAFLTNGASGTAGQEAIRINNDNGYIGFFNGANSTRSGYIQGNTTDVTIATSPSNPLIFATANVEKMRITSGGQVGIGTPSPNSLLHLFGSSATLTIDDSGNGTSKISFRPQGTSYSERGFLSINYQTGELSLGAGIATNTYFQTFYLNGSPRMTITSGGEVLVGGTSNVAGGIIQALGSNGTTITTRTTTAGNTAPGIRFYHDGNDEFVIRGGDGLRFFGSGVNERMRITSGGNVEIGTGSLSVANGNQTANSISSTIFFGNRGFITGANVGAAQISAISTGTFWYSGTALAFYTNPGPDVTATANVERMRIQSNGIVGFSAVYANTTTLAANLYIDSGTTGLLYRSTSSIKYKKDIEDLNIDIFGILNKMRPVWYRSLGTNDRKDWSWYGFIAEELAKIEPRLVHFGYNENAYEIIETINENGEKQIKKELKKDAIKDEPDGVQYERITVLLVKAIQEQQAQIEELKSKLN